jgi:hypothetical protein
LRASVTPFGEPADERALPYDQAFVLLGEASLRSLDRNRSNSIGGFAHEPVPAGSFHHLIGAVHVISQGASCHGFGADHARPPVHWA